MMYLSKGVVLKNSGGNGLVISRCGEIFPLSDDCATLWLNGRFHPGKTDNPAQKHSLNGLIEKGLVETSDESGDTASYRLLTNCVICHTKPKAFNLNLNKQEQILWTWLTQAGGKLTISELILLAEKGVTPDKSLLGIDNRAILVHTIYSTETIFDGILEAKMENSPALTETIAAVLGLLRKKRIVLI